MSDALENAVRLHEEGQLASAAETYERVLTEDPFNREALYLFGMLRSQRGDHAGAMELMGRLAVWPHQERVCFAFHAELRAVN